MDFGQRRRGLFLSDVVTEEVNAVIRDLANGDDRTVAWMLRMGVESGGQLRLEGWTKSW